jgi:hypothetical protein
MTTTKRYSNPNDEVTPADLDPNRKDGSDNVDENKPAPHDEEKVDYKDVHERLKVEGSGETANDPNGGMITYIQNNIPDGQGGIKEIVHGPMPRAEWNEYSRKKGI